MLRGRLVSPTIVTRTALLLGLGLGACAGSAAPTAMRTVSSLPDDPQRRSETLDSAQARPGPEQRPRSKKAQRVETTAATMAAIAGMIFSKSSSVVLGVGSPVDENLIVDPDARAGKRRGQGGGDDDGGGDRDAAGRPGESHDASRLVPWVRLGPHADAPGAPAAPADHGDRAPPRR
jgi:hypothetical protein